MGVVAAIGAAQAGVGVAELVAAARRDFQCPVLDVGETNDKKVLLIGIASILVAYAAVVGVLVSCRCDGGSGRQRSVSPASD